MTNELETSDSILVDIQTAEVELNAARVLVAEKEQNLARAMGRLRRWRKPWEQMR